MSNGSIHVMNFELSRDFLHFHTEENSLSALSVELISFWQK
jgi:hypothetical protein